MINEQSITVFAIVAGFALLILGKKAVGFMILLSILAGFIFVMTVLFDGPGGLY